MIDKCNTICNCRGRTAYTLYRRYLQKFYPGIAKILDVEGLTPKEISKKEKELLNG